MSKRHLFVMDPIEKINPTTDSTYDIMLECQSRDHDIWECSIKEIFVKNGIAKAKTRKIALDETSPRTSKISFKTQEETTKNFDEFDYVWMRKDPPVDEEFIASLHLLSCSNGTVQILNSARGLLLASEKLWPLGNAAQYMPQTLVSANQDLLYQTAQELGRVVVKPLFQAGGAGVMVFDANDKNLKSAISLLTAEGQKNAMMQAYIQGAELGDKRIILVGGEPVGAILRIPGKDDYRANLHVGGKAFKTELTDREKEICIHLKPFLIANGLFLVGIDVINGFLTEVNVTSPTGLQEIDQLNHNKGSARIRARLLDWIEENLTNP